MGRLLSTVSFLSTRNSHHLLTWTNRSFTIHRRVGWGIAAQCLSSISPGASLSYDVMVNNKWSSVVKTAERTVTIRGAHVNGWIFPSDARPTAEPAAASAAAPAPTPEKTPDPVPDARKPQPEPTSDEAREAVAKEPEIDEDKAKDTGAAASSTGPPALAQTISSDDKSSDATKTSESTGSVEASDLPLVLGNLEEEPGVEDEGIDDSPPPESSETSTPVSTANSLPGSAPESVPGSTALSTPDSTHALGGSYTGGLAATSGTPGLSTSAKIGVSVGGSCAFISVVALLLTLWLFRRRRQRRQAAAAEISNAEMFMEKIVTDYSTNPGRGKMARLWPRRSGAEGAMVEADDAALVPRNPPCYDAQEMEGSFEHEPVEIPSTPVPHWHELGGKF